MTDMTQPLPTDPQQVGADELKSWLRDDVAAEVQQILDERPDNFPKHTAAENGALLVWVAQTFIDANPNDLLFTDGENDGQIDIFHDSTTEDRVLFRLYQVSAPSLDELGAGRRGKDIGDKLDTDARGVHNRIADPKVKRPRFNETAQQAIGLLNDAISAAGDKSGPEVVIEICPITLRRVAEEKLKRYDALRTEAREKWNELPNVKWVLRPPLLAEELLIQYFQKRRPANLPQDLELATPFGVATDDVSRGPVLAFVSAFDVIEAYRKYRAMLFDSNLRYELGKSTAVNGKIAEELGTAKGIRRFHEKNNGIVVSCTNCRLGKPNKKSESVVSVKLVRPQIINGAQTVSTIFRVFSELAAIPVGARDARDTERLEAFTKQLVLPAKVVITDENSWKRVDEIAIASNTQNPLSPRTLRSSSLEMRRLKRMLAAATQPWYAETKDGEWEAVRDLKSVVQSATNGKTPRDFMYGPKKSEVRRVDNKELGVALLAFHGFVEAAKVSALFDRGFLRAFNYKVRDDKWSDLAQTSCRVVGASDDVLAGLFDAAPAGPHQSLLAYFLHRYLNRWTFPETRQLELAYAEAAKKDPAFEQYKQKDGTWTVPDEKKAELLKNDDSCYWTERIAKAASKVLLHQAMRVLVRRYGNLTDDTCRGILVLPEFKELLDGKPADVLPDFRESSLTRGPLTALARILHLGCKHLWDARSTEIRALLSPQQVLLTQQWAQRLGDQIDMICAKLDKHGFRTASGLDPTGDADIKGLEDLLPTLSRPAEKGA